MSRSHSFYLQLSLSELEKIVEAHQAEFDLLLEDTFSDEELQRYEKIIDSIAAIYPQVISTELSFDDLFPKTDEENKQRSFFESCKSSICLENLPFFEDNPFQVTYLMDLLWSFEDVLVDKGGMHELVFRKDYLNELREFKNMESLICDLPKIVQDVKGPAPVTSIDFTIIDIYKELKRLKNVNFDSEDLSPMAKMIFDVMKDEELDSESVFMRSRLNPKDFDDNLEKLKFWLRKIKSENS